MRPVAFSLRHWHASIKFVNAGMTYNLGKVMQLLPLPTCTHGDPSTTPMACLVIDRLDGSELAITQTPSLRQLINEVV